MDTKNLRNALSKFATGITVITTSDEHGNPFGVTVNSFTSVSLEPPLILWCLGDQTFALDVFLQADYFVVNILSSDQENISTNFAIPGEFDRFADISYQIGIAPKVPLINNCLANLQCSRHSIDRQGDHWVFISKIEDTIINYGTPLIYFESQYSSLKE